MAWCNCSTQLDIYVLLLQLKSSSEYLLFLNPECCHVQFLRCHQQQYMLYDNNAVKQQCNFRSVSRITEMIGMCTEANASWILSYTLCMKEMRSLLELRVG
uniref:Uncharacterized protein n=1 Tax=Oryza barthii TaxID=65489 RepID=A0A0D3HW61_9ORYZ